MFPNFTFAEIPVGPLTIRVWGLMVALGILVALFIGKQVAKRRGLKADFFFDSGLWIIIAGFVGARLVHVLFYDLGFYLEHPIEIFRVWHGGFSSLGGFIGSALFGVWYLRRKKIDVWKYADVAAFALPWGWMIGRIGCFFIHDHPGTLTHFVLAVREPGALGEEGIGRHDLGLYDAILALVIGVIIYVLRKKKAFDGYFMLLVIVLYSVPRFFLDFLRANDLALSDARYAGLTPAQYGAIVAVIFATWIWRKKSKYTHSK